MTILDIELVHFGKFHYKKVRFSQGLNVVYGNNEAGKSTIHAFIRCMLLGMETEAPEGKESVYDRFFPWEDHGGYGGKMRLELKGRVYRIERDFRKECPSMRLIDEETGKELDQPQARLKELLDGLNETNYDNTISIEQLKSPADPELAGDVVEAHVSLPPVDDIIARCPMIQVPAGMSASRATSGRKRSADSVVPSSLLPLG